MKTHIILCFAVLFSSALVGCSSATHPSIADRQWGPAIGGLQLSLAVLKADPRDDPLLEATFRNDGVQDVCLNLGIMLDNGRLQFPDKNSLNLIDANGKTRKLLFSGPPAVAGRVDDYVVPMRAGSTYTLRSRLDRFWSPSAKQFGLTLKPGRYEISVQFQEDHAETRNLIVVWTGKIQSNSEQIVE